MLLDTTAADRLQREFGRAGDGTPDAEIIDWEREGYITNIPLLEAARISWSPEWEFATQHLFGYY